MTVESEKTDFEIIDSDCPQHEKKDLLGNYSEHGACINDLKLSVCVCVFSFSFQHNAFHFECLGIFSFSYLCKGLKRY